MKETQLAHLAGAFDEAGNISVNIAKLDNRKIGYEFRPVVRHNHKYDDRDDPLVEKIMVYCDEYGVRGNIIDLEEESKSTVEVHRLEIKAVDGIEQFLKPILPYLVSEYENAMTMIEGIIPRVRDDQHLEREGFYELMGYVDRLRKYDPKIKYTQEYFAEEWEDELSVVQ